MKLTRKILAPYVAAKLVNEIKHPTEDLCMYKYTQSCTFEKKWDAVTLQCRGIILDADNNIVARPFDKFFNYEEHESSALPVIPTDIDFDVYTKLDGSLGIMYIVNDKVFITTAGSFISEQGAKATEILNNQYASCVDRIVTTWRNFTYLFEIIYPDDLHVVNYRGMEDIVLIGIRNKNNGKDIDLNSEFAHSSGILLDFNVVNTFNVANEFKHFKALQELNLQNEEGYVLRYKNGFRVKVKFADYCILHRNKALLSKKTILQSLINGVDILSVLPEEDSKWANELIIEFNHTFKEIYLLVEMYTFNLRREYGGLSDEHLFKKMCANDIFINPEMKQYSSAIFQALDKKDYSKTIWQYIKNTI